MKAKQFQSTVNNTWNAKIDKSSMKIKLQWDQTNLSILVIMLIIKLIHQPANYPIGLIVLSFLTMRSFNKLSRICKSELKYGPVA